MIFLLLLESIWCSLAVHSPPTRLERNVVNLNSIVARGEAPEEGEGYIGLNTEENTQHKTQGKSNIIIILICNEFLDISKIAKILFLL